MKSGKNISPDPCLARRSAHERLDDPDRAPRADRVLSVQNAAAAPAGGPHGLCVLFLDLLPAMWALGDFLPRWQILHKSRPENCGGQSEEGYAAHCHEGRQ